jgi:hypothetical protein
MELLIVSLIFVFRDLITPELEIIASAIRDGRIRDMNGADPEPPTDPCPEIIRALALFLDWYTLARRNLFPVSMAPELQRRCRAMKEALKRVFPEKSGELAAWNFPKFHGVDHKASEILMFGSSPYTDTNIFESAHKPNVKNLSGNSNGKDLFMTISRIHNQSSILSELKHALVRQESRILRAAESSSSDSESEIDCEVDDDDLLIDEVTSRPCELAMRMPLWDMTYDLDALHREPFCLGQGGRGQHRIILAACKQGASGHSGKPSFRYRFAEELPSLRFLGTQLAHFAYEFLGEQLGLDPLVPEEERDIARALSFLEPDNDKCDIFTFGGLAIRSSHHKGTVRVRARPFDSFHGKYPQVNAL